MPLAGACLCGAIRYEIAPDPHAVADYCHCRQCQQASGAPVLAWVQVKPAQFRVTHGAATPYASSTHSTRWFCHQCGTQLYMTDSAETSVGVTLASLDDPSTVHPTVHGWDSERITWFNTTDTLPRYAQAPPYDE